MFCVQEVIIKTLAKTTQLLPVQHQASASEQRDRWFVLGLNHHPEVQEHTHNPRLAVPSIILYTAGGAVVSIYFNSFNKDFHCSFQTTFSPSSPGQRRDFPLMTATLIKPSGYQRTLTIWTDYQLFYQLIVTVKREKKCLTFSLKAVYLVWAVWAYVLCIRVKINAL